MENMSVMTSSFFKVKCLLEIIYSAPLVTKVTKYFLVFLNLNFRVVNYLALCDELYFLKEELEMKVVTEYLASVLGKRKTINYQQLLEYLPCLH